MNKNIKVVFIFLLLIVISIISGCATKNLLYKKDIREVSIIESAQETFNTEALESSENQIKKDVDLLEKVEQEKLQEQANHGLPIGEQSESQIYVQSNKKDQMKSIPCDAIPPESESLKCIYLTFDDGPSAVTGEILDVLKKHDVKATFFVNGYVKSNYSIYSRMIHRIVNEGHALGNHGYDHDYRVSYASKKAFKDNVDKLNQLLEDITGVQPTLYRFQGGSSNTVHKRYLKDATMKELFKLIKDDGFMYFDWNVDTRDSEEDTPSVKRTVKYALEGVQGKTDAIVLMHDSEDKIKTPEAVDFIVKRLKEQGYKFNKLSKDSFNFQHRK